MKFNLNNIKSNVGFSLNSAFDTAKRINKPSNVKKISNESVKQSGAIKRFYGIGEGNELSNFQRNLRYGTTIGVGATIGGASVYNRYKSGGTVTTNSKGEKDIVGIPIL